MKKRTLLILVGGAVFITTSVLVGAILYKQSFIGKFPGGTYVAGIELSYKSPEEAIIILDKAKGKYLQNKIKITILGKTKEFTPEELGIKVAVEDTVRALKIIDSEWKLWNIFNSENEYLNPVIILNYDKLFSTISTNFKLDEIAPKEATFYFDEKNKLSIKEGQSGTVIERDKFIEELKSSAKQLKNDDIKIDTISREPSFTKELLMDRKTQIEESLNQNINLLDPVYSDDWHIKLKDHLDWVIFVQKEEIFIPFSNKKVLINPSPEHRKNEVIAIEIDQEKLNKFVDEKISKWLDRPAENVNIYTNPEGKIIIEGKGSDGKKIQRQFLKQAMELALINKISDVPIPVVNITPEIKISEDLQKKGIKERISVGHTSYYNSPANRVHNIKAGSGKFNGALIEPGEIFSFNESLGPVDESTGFKKELVIKKEGTIPEYGGGICQVSTTMYRAALFAGLSITERNQHTYAVSYYSQILGHGLDATIYLGGANLKFKNDTGNSILIQTYTEKDYELFIVFYGTADGRRVEMEGPYLSSYHYPGPTEYVDEPDMPVGTKKQIEKAHTGFNAMWYRHLFDKDGNEKKEPISTHYKAIPARILVGTKAAAEPPAP